MNLVVLGFLFSLASLYHIDTWYRRVSSSRETPTRSGFQEGEF